MKFVKVMCHLLSQHYPDVEKLSSIKTIVICDPGVDDLLMLLQILSSSFYEVVGIVPVQGNTTCFQAVQNTLNVCELLGKSTIGIYAGSGYDPFAPPQAEETAVYGENGLNAHMLPTALHMKLMSKSGIEFVCESLISDKYLLISTGTLIELAKIVEGLAKKYPEALKNIIAISMMGGVINATQEANWPIHGQRLSEANISYDTHASEIVFEIAASHKIPILLAPLDLTHSVLASESDVLMLSQIDNAASSLATKLIRNVPEHYQRRYQRGPDLHYRQPLHDMHAVSCLLHPDLYHGQWVRIRVDHELAPQHMHIVDDTDGNVCLVDMHYMQREKFFMRFADDLRSFSAKTL
jgi:inosine-uridine nucleoside N-ribohydrolase